MVKFRCVCILIAVILSAQTLFAAGNDLNINDYHYVYNKDVSRVTSLGDTKTNSEPVISKMRFKDMFKILNKYVYDLKIEARNNHDVVIKYNVRADKFPNKEDINKIYDTISIYEDIYCNNTKNCFLRGINDFSSSKSGELASFSENGINVEINKDLIGQIFENGHIDPWVMRLVFEPRRKYSIDETVSVYNKVKNNFKKTDYFIAKTGSKPKLVKSEQDLLEILGQ